MSSIKQCIKASGKMFGNVTLLTVFFVLKYFLHKSMLFMLTFNECIIFKLNTLNISQCLIY